MNMDLVYQPCRGWWQRRHALARAAVVMQLMVAVSLHHGGWPLSLLFWLVLHGAFAGAGVPLRPGYRMVVRLWPVLFVVAVLPWLQGVADPAGVAADVFSRTTTVMLAAALLLLTCSQGELRLVVEFAVQPWRRVGLPVGSVALMMLLALRFLPLLMGEADRLLLARALRGGHFGAARNRQWRVAAVLPLLIPLLAQVVTRARELAMAMAARGFVVDADRSQWRARNLDITDWVTMAATAAALVVCIVYF